MTHRADSQSSRHPRSSFPGRAVTALASVVFFLTTSHSICHAAIFEGYAQVGSKVFNVSLEVVKSDGGKFWVACAVTQDGGLVARLGVELSDSGAIGQTEDGPLRLPVELAAQWRSQLGSKFLDLLDTVEFLVSTGSNGAVTCESRRPISLTDALVGRLKLTYQVIKPLAPGDTTMQRLRENPDNLELTEIQAFSLDEWLNGFGERVILSLRRNPGATGGQPW